MEKIRAQSPVAKSGPWVTHFEEMAQKTVIRRLFKYLPVSVEMARAVGLDEAAERSKQSDAIDADCVIESEEEATPEEKGDSAA